MVHKSLLRKQRGIGLGVSVARVTPGSENQPVLSALLDYLADGALALLLQKALLLAFHQQFKITPHFGLLHIRTMTFSYGFLFFSEFLA